MKRFWFMLSVFLMSVILPSCMVGMAHAETVTNASFYPSDMACCPVSVHIETPSANLPGVVPDVVVPVIVQSVSTMTLHEVSDRSVASHYVFSRQFFERCSTQRE